MNGRIMKKEEFVARMLVDQELRREKKNKEKHSILYGYVKERSTRIDHRHHLRMKRSGGVKGV